jgi:hypothetical protein
VISMSVEYKPTRALVAAALSTVVVLQLCGCHTGARSGSTQITSLAYAQWSSVPPTASPVDWQTSDYCASVRGNQGAVCDEHQVSFVPVTYQRVRQVIHSTPEGENVFLYLPPLKRIRHVGTTPYTFYVASEKVSGLAFCAGPCLGPDVSRFVQGQPRDIEIVFTQEGDGLRNAVTPLK